MKRLSILLALALLLAACDLNASSDLPTEAGPSEQPAANEPAASASPEAGQVTFVKGLPSDMVLAQGLPLPNGLSATTNEGIGLTFHGLDGIALGEIRRPPQASFSAGNVHVADEYVGMLDFPLVFYRGEFEGNCGDCGLWVTQNDQVSRLAAFREMEALAGVPGKPILAYVERQYNNETGVLRSLLFVGTLETLPAASPAMILDSTESRVVVPVAIRLDDAGMIPTGVWYTQRPYGIGGNIIFYPSEGLYFLDLTTATSHEVLPASARFSSISTSQTWIAYNDSQTQAEVNNLIVRNLRNNQSLTFPSLMDSDRGAGAAAFSADGYYVAWMEASGGLLDDNVHYTIRVATNEGLTFGDFPEERFYQAAGLGTEIQIYPIGFAGTDQNLILVRVTAPGNENPAAILMLDFLENEITFLAPGEFVGFIYP